jgi:hypothetical protein
MQFNDTIALGRKLGTYDDNGFLRVKARIARAGVHRYKPEEVGVRSNEPYINVYHPPETLGDAETLKSLEGMVVTVGHEWLEDCSDVKERQVGQIAGSPEFNGNFIISDILITDKNVAEKIHETGELVELSPGYTSNPEFVTGVADGESYDIVKKDFRYNHVALLPQGRARGGSSIRITDEKGEDEMTDKLVKLALDGGSTISLDENSVSSVQALSDDLKRSQDELVKAQDEIVGLEEKLAKLSEINSQMDALKAERDELAGQLDAVKAEMDKAMSPEALSAQADELADTREEAAAVMGEDQLPEELRKLGVADLKKAVVQKHMDSLGRSLDGQDLTDDYVNGVWSTITATASKQGGNGMANVAKKAMDSNGVSKQRTAAEKLGFKKKGE